MPGVVIRAMTASAAAAVAAPEVVAFREDAPPVVEEVELPVLREGHPPDGSPLAGDAGMAEARP
jgi:hypothetical protein